MTSLCALLAQAIPEFRKITKIQSASSTHRIYNLTINDADALRALLQKFVKDIEGVSRYENDPEYRSYCEKNGLAADALFGVPATKQLKRVELGDIGELIGCLVLGAHFNINPTSMFTRNLARPSVEKSQDGYDIAVIDLDLSNPSTLKLAPGDSFTAVESKAADNAPPSALSYKAKASFTQSAQEVRKHLQMYMYFAQERFGSCAAIDRIPSFIVDHHTKTANFKYSSVATTCTSASPTHIATIETHLDEVLHGTAILCCVQATAIRDFVFSFRQAS